MRDLVEEALETLRPALAADGFALKVLKVEPSGVTVVLEALENACLDCLVPEDVMRRIVDAAVREKVPAIGQVHFEMRV